jgi:NAD-dependent deacetylase
MQEKIETIGEWIVASGSTVVFVGAGMSTESGIPDFRSPGGVWDRYDPEDFQFDRFLTDERSRENYWKMATEMYDSMKNASPNAGHRAIAELEKLGKLDCLITQNIDGLHFKAGNSAERVLELHGTAMEVACVSCGKRFEREPVQARLESGTAEAYRRSEASDLFIVVGSSLVVHPAASMPVLAKRSGGRLVIVNRDETPLDNLADLVVRGEAGKVMDAVLARVRERLGDPGNHPA